MKSIGCTSMDAIKRTKELAIALGRTEQRPTSEQIEDWMNKPDMKKVRANFLFNTKQIDRLNDFSEKLFEDGYMVYWNSPVVPGDVEYMTIKKRTYRR